MAKDVKDRVVKQAAIWLDVAQKGGISYETASLLINAFELGMSEMAEALNSDSGATEAYAQVADVNQYIKSLGKDVVFPPNSYDAGSVAQIEDSIRAVVNFSSRSLNKSIRDLGGK